MTRINVGIPPRALSDKHLLAEHREIKRIKTNVPCFTPFINAEALFDCSGTRYGFRIKTLKNVN